VSDGAASIAAKVAFIVEGRWGEAEGVEPRDLNDVFLLAAYPRAYRCFMSIRRLCADPDCDGEDPLILTRALVSLVLRSLWPIESGVASEREERAQRRAWWTVTEERKRLRALDDPTDADHLRRIEDDLQELETWFAARGETPSELNEADLAKKLNLPVLYDLIYRMGSATIHHSQLAALGSFSGKLNPADPFPALPLRFPKPAETDQVLLWAITVYAVFLERAEPAVRLGIGPDVEALVRPWVEEQHRLATT
jgi:hypothetical protein